MLIGGFVFTHGEEPVSQEGVSSYSYRSKMSGKQRRKVLMNRNDMPFLGVYDLFGTALIVPLHINTGDGALFLNISYHRFFSRLPKSEGWQIRTPSLSCIYILTAVSLWSCIGKRIDADGKKTF